MRTTNPIASLLGSSPFKPMQAHMRIVQACVAEVPALFEALIAGDKDRLTAQKDLIFAKEHEADELKNDLRAHLLSALAEVAAQGYAVEDEEAVLGEASIAVPVADRDGEAVAAVAVVLPASEQPVAASVLTLLRETARNVSRELGGTWPPVSVRAPEVSRQP